MFITCRVCEGQNLVPNGNFDQYSSCPTNFGQLSVAVPWMNPSNGWGSPDYYNVCDTINVGVPRNIAGYQHARSGDGYSGIFLTYLLNIREYIEAPLTATLMAGTCYYFEMYVSQANRYQYTTDALGIYFSDTAILNIPNYNNLPYAPQINNNGANLFDTLSWTLVSGIYTANGTENYLIIGNFKDDINTSLVLSNPQGDFPFCYVYIDDVSLTPCTGMQDHSILSEINIFPIPVNDKLNISINNDELTEIVLYDITSKKLLQNHFIRFISLSTEQLAKGIYIYEVRNKDGSYKKGKLVKD